MAPHTNSFFNSVYPGQSSEQSLIDDLVIEQIAIFGLDVLYMPRKHLNLDKLLHEGSKCAFEFAMPIPMYLKTFSGYNNGLEMLTKFGVRSSDEVTLVLSRSQFNTHYAPFIKSYYNAIDGRDPKDNLNYLEGQTSRPKEGDLIYFPFDDGIFEIKYVMFDQPFFQLGRGYVYELQCEKFEFSGESFETEYPEIDEVDMSPDYYRMVMDVDNGAGTFEIQERVILYNATNFDAAQTMLNDLSEALLSESRQLITEDGQVDKEFLMKLHTEDRPSYRLYLDAGFLHGVPMVMGTVMDWNAKTKQLTLGDLTDLDPDFIGKDEYPLNVDSNKFDNSLIIGTKSGSQYVSTSANEVDGAFNDNITVQEEFDDIKIIDEFDQSPFGFI